MFKQARWINTGRVTGNAAPEYRKSWHADAGKQIRSATLTITALGVY